MSSSIFSLVVVVIYYWLGIVFICVFCIVVKAVSLITREDCKKIIYYSKKILLRAIKKGGSSIRDFKDTLGSSGNYQKEFKVYQQEGLRCKTIGCTDTIQKKIVSNRSTFFCNSCQN